MCDFKFDGAVKYDGEDWESISSLLSYIESNPLNIKDIIKKHTTRDGIFRREVVNWKAVHEEAERCVGWGWDTGHYGTSVYKYGWVYELIKIRQMMYTSSDMWITPKQSHALRLAQLEIENRINSL